MTINVVGEIDRLLRSAALDVLARRDRLSGWKLYRDAFLASTRKDRESLARDVESKLSRILVHAYETSPYYRDAWKAIGFHPSPSFRSDDLQQLPFLTKDIIRDRTSLLVSERFPSHELDLSYTGGTTGPPTSFYLDHACWVSRVGRQRGILELCGYRPGTRRAFVWGVHADLPPAGMKQTLKRWFREYASSQEVLCCTLMTERMMMDYHTRLLRFRPKILYGYPSAMAQLGSFMLERNLKPIRVKSIITTAERLTQTHRDFLQQVFGGEVFNLYCTREYGCIGFECSRHDGFHIDTESVFVEIIKNGRRASQGESGEITITDLQNYGMPFIRSRTGDVGALSSQPCECGLPLPVLRRLDGRSTDFIYRPDGAMVPGLMFADLFRDIPLIRYAQFVQEAVSELDVLVVVTGELTDGIKREATRQVRELVGSDMTVRIKSVPEIARSPRSGKFREVICKISRREESHIARSQV